MSEFESRKGNASPDKSYLSTAVTPGIHTSGISAYIEPDEPVEVLKDQNAGPKKIFQSHINKNTELRDRSEITDDYIEAESSGSGNEKPDSSPFHKPFNPLKIYPNLCLSGRIINAAFTIPYAITYDADESSWELNTLNTTPDLSDSLSYQISSPSWNQVHVGWTAEISRRCHENSSDRTDRQADYAVPSSNSATPFSQQEKLGDQVTTSEDIQLSRSEMKSLETLLEHQNGSKLYPVWLPSEVHRHENIYSFKDQERWRKFAEEEVYTVFHYGQSEPANGPNVQKSWLDYTSMNKAFADRILEIYKPGDIVIIHDFYLLLLPAMLRQRLPNLYVSLYLHVPFPSSEFYRCLGRRKELLDGMLGSNLIGFQSFDYLRHFSSCCTRILGHESSSTGVDVQGIVVALQVLPTGINTRATRKMAFDNPSVQENFARICQMYTGREIVIGRDRLDSIRSVAQKLRAFRLFLEKYPSWQNKVKLIQITCPGPRSGEKGELYKTMVSEVSELVSEINGTYGSLSFAPVQYFPQDLSPDEYFALLRASSVGLITSTRDGINTTSLEYVMCQSDSCNPLIVSEFSGTARSLTTAIHVNPWDLGGVAEAIDYSLRMSRDEKLIRYRKLRRSVEYLDVASWINGYLKALLTSISSMNRSLITPILDHPQVLSQYKKARRRLLMFDYDGTLTPIVKDPSAAIPSEKLIRTLKALAADSNNFVWIISGRDQAFLDEWMGHINALGLSAEHGSFMRYPNTESWENLAENIDMSWQNEVIKIFQRYTENTQGSFIEQKKIALTWHYRRSDPEYGARQAKDCQILLEDTIARRCDIEVMAGKANLEVRPKLLNKGEIAKRLTKMYGGTSNSLDFVLCLGDDYTDEDMFRALRRSDVPATYVFAVTIGPASKQTLANWHLMEPSEVISTLTSLTELTNAGLR